MIRNFFYIELSELQPTQLYINSDKLDNIVKRFSPITAFNLTPIPVYYLGNDIILTDGHTRAYAAYQNGVNTLKVYWDEDELDWDAYRICVNWCKTEGIFRISDLSSRIVKNSDYDNLWLTRCHMMHADLDRRRKS